jgi:DUF971 family protein
MAIPHPTEVKYLESEHTLRVTFSDDVVIDYPTAFLRGFCPCAHCQGHSGGLPTWEAPATEAATRVENVTPVGNYAMCILWGDGHDTGIYSFRALREMDPEAFSPDEMTADTTMPTRDE